MQADVIRRHSSHLRAIPKVGPCAAFSRSSCPAPGTILEGCNAEWEASRPVWRTIPPALQPLGQVLDLLSGAVEGGAAVVDEGDAALVVGEGLFEPDLAGLDALDDRFHLRERGFEGRGWFRRVRVRLGRWGCAWLGRHAGA